MRRSRKGLTFNICATVLVLSGAVFFLGCTIEQTSSNSDAHSVTVADGAIDINLASAEELAKIPHIGPKLAGSIVEFRELHGPFRRPEHLMLIRGISNSRYHEIRAFVKTQ